jgi:hypothetical protein
MGRVKRPVGRDGRSSRLYRERMVTAPMRRAPGAAGFFPGGVALALAAGFVLLTIDASSPAGPATTEPGGDFA